MKAQAILLWTSVVLLLSRGVTAQEVIKTGDDAPPTWIGVRALLERVSTLRVEYSADLGLAILRQAHSTVPPAAAKIFLDGLFASAHNARYQTGFLDAAYSRTPSSKALEAITLRANKADALSIQTAVVEQMRADSPQAAAQRFTEIQLTPQRSTCADLTVQDLSPYYAAMQSLFDDPRIVTFGVEPRGQFLLDHLREAVTPEQFVPLITVLSHIDPGPEDGEAALQIAAANIGRMTASNRELDALDTQLNRAMQTLESYAERRHVDLTGIVVAYRAFLLRSAATHACVGDPHFRKYTAVNFGVVRNRLGPTAQSLVAPLTSEELATTEEGDSASDPPIPILPGLPMALQKRLGPSDFPSFNGKPPVPLTEEGARWGNGGLRPVPLSSPHPDAGNVDRPPAYERRGAHPAFSRGELPV